MGIYIGGSPCNQTPWRHPHVNVPKKEKKKNVKKPIIVCLKCEEHGYTKVKGNYLVPMSEELLLKNLKCECGKELDYKPATDEEIFYFVYSFLNDFKLKLEPSLLEWLARTDEKLFGWIKRMRTTLVKNLAKDLPKEIQDKI